MNKKILALCGTLILCIGVVAGLYIRNLQKVAIGRDAEPLPKTAAGCDIFLSDVHVSKRAMAENESQALIIDIVNGVGDCGTTVTLNAPNFDISPYENKQDIRLPTNGRGSVNWILTPKRTGVFDVSVSIAHGTQSKIVGITVTNLFGLTAVQAQIVSYAGSFLGPMLTAPWWYEVWKKGKVKGKKVSRAKPKS